MSNWLDLSGSSNKLKQTYVSGFVDISGQGVNIRNGSLQLFDSSNISKPSFSINAEGINIYDGIGNYIDVSNSKLIFLKDVSENIQVRLDDLISRTQTISTGLTTSDGLKQVIINGDISANGKFSAQGDVSFGNDVTIAGNLRTQYPPASIPQSAISGGVGGIYIPTDITSFDDDMFALVKEFKQESTLIDASVNGNLSISGTTKLNGNVVINGKVNIDKDVYIAGNLSANYANQSIPISALQGNLKTLGGGGSFYTPTEKTTFDEDQFALLKELDTSGGNTAVSDASVLGTLTVDGNSFLNSNVTITGDLSMIGNIYATTQRLDDSSDKIATTSYVQNTLFRQFIP